MVGEVPEIRLAPPLWMKLAGTVVKVLVLRDPVIQAAVIQSREIKPAGFFKFMF